MDFLELSWTVMIMISWNYDNFVWILDAERCTLELIILWLFGCYTWISRRYQAKILLCCVGDCWVDILCVWL